MNVLLIGNGGREHAIAWKLAQSKDLTKLYIATGNPGTAQFGENIPISADNADELLDFSKQNDIGLVVVGPEDPLAAGLVDKFEAAGIKAFGPSGGAAQLEADKAFAKQLMRSRNFPPSRRCTGCPHALPAMSHKAISTPASAWFAKRRISSHLPSR